MLYLPIVHQLNQKFNLKITIKPFISDTFTNLFNGWLNRWSICCNMLFSLVHMTKKLASRGITVEQNRRILTPFPDNYVYLAWYHSKNNSYSFLKVSRNMVQLSYLYKRTREGQRMRWFDSIINSMDMSLSKLLETVKDREAWHAAVHVVFKLDTTSRLNNSFDMESETISMNFDALS